MLDHHQPRHSCLSPLRWRSHTADTAPTHCPLQHSAAPRVHAWVLHGLRELGQAPGEAACKRETEAREDRVLLPPLRKPKIACLTEINSQAKGLFQPHPPQCGRTFVFTLQWFCYTDFPVKERQLQNDVTSDTFTAIKHSKTSGGPGALVCPSLLPSCQKSLLTTRSLGFWSSNPTRSFSYTLDIYERSLIPTALLQGSSQHLPKRC